MAAERFAFASDGHRRIRASGPWTVADAASIEKKTEAVKSEATPSTSLEIDLSGIERLDTFGSWLIERLIRDLTERGVSVGIIGVPERFQDLLYAVHKCDAKTLSPPARHPILLQLENLGVAAAQLGRDLVRLIAYLPRLHVSSLWRRPRCVDLWRHESGNPPRMVIKMNRPTRINRARDSIAASAGYICWSPASAATKICFHPWMLGSEHGADGALGDNFSIDEHDNSVEPTTSNLRK